MTQYDRSTVDKRLTSTFRALANGRRRRLLGLVRERSPDGVPIADLATALAAWTRDGSPGSISEAQRDTTRAELHHVHLPMLEAAGFLEYDESRGVATARRDPPLMDPDVVESVTAVGAASTTLDDVFDALADTRRRTILFVLAREGELELGELAENVATEGRTDADPDRVSVSLVHADLPKLCDAGLVEYDPEAGVAAFDDDPHLRTRWIAPVHAMDSDGGWRAFDDLERSDPSESEPNAASSNGRSNRSESASDDCLTYFSR